MQNTVMQLPNYSLHMSDGGCNHWVSSGGSRK